MSTTVGYVGPDGGMVGEEYVGPTVTTGSVVIPVAFVVTIEALLDMHKELDANFSIHPV